MSDDLLNLLFSMEGSKGEPTREIILKAPFGWPGGKSRSVKEIIPHLPIRKIYVEPFGGSGVILLNKEPCKVEVFNDRYSGVVDFYRVLRDEETKNQLLERVNTAIFAREEFIWCRDTWNQVTGVERAARWMYMIQSSFASLGRNFGRSTINSPSSGATRIFKDRIHFDELHNRLKRVTFENQDWEQCARDFDSLDTVHYFDPPYVKTATGTYEHNFSIHDHEHMLDTIFNRLKGFVAVSAYSSSLYDKYQWDNIIQWKSTVTMNPKVRGGRGQHVERDADNEETLLNHSEVEHLFIKEAR